jgi:hypothetical protein
MAYQTAHDFGNLTGVDTSNAALTAKMAAAIVIASLRISSFTRDSPARIRGGGNGEVSIAQQI